MSRPYNLEVTPKPGESSEKLIRRFFKKCKKLDIIKEHLEKVSYFRTRTQKKRDKIQKNKHLRKVEAYKAQKKRFRK